MQNKHYLGIMLVGFFLFIGGAGHILLGHDSWSDFKSPAGVGELFVELCTVGVTVGGALGFTLGNKKEEKD